MEYKVRLTDSGFQTLTQLSRYMIEYIGYDRATALASSLLDLALQKLSGNPLQFSVLHELEALGVIDYRAIYHDNYKIIFRLDEASQTCFVMAFLRQNQSVQQALYQVLLYK
ncbi:MAG: hypothetical protein GYB30_07585 [Gammaproteobacteria bacterium]|jgi:plasmid stabilization system protein ParE|nr:hypothetical protein [Gammaproteobacteria bacterium]